MTRWTKICAALLACAALAWAGSGWAGMLRRGGVPVSASCSTVHIENTAAESDTFYGSTAQWIGQWNVAGSNISICKVQFTGNLQAVNYKASVWTFNGGTYALDTQQGAYSANTL